MHPNRIGALLCAAIGAIALQQPAHAQDAGKSAFQQCAACHAADDANGVGPGLKGLVGRKSGAHEGFRYSRAMKGAGITWDEKSLDAFLADPQKAVPGNQMPFAGLADARQRAELIAYLKSL